MQNHLLKNFYSKVFAKSNEYNLPIDELSLNL